MTRLTRRSFLRRSAIAGGTAVAFQGLINRSEIFEARGARPASSFLNAVGFGPLTPKATVNTGETLLALPEGFRYNVLGATGALMSDGRPTPGLHDGMAAFALDGKIRLVRNHELGQGAAPGTIPYDSLAAGGTTTLVVDPVTRLVEQDFLSLSGTIRNCAGGPTPWGTWLSCEESTVGVYSSPATNLPHGYAFDVAANANGEVTPVALKDMGRMSHEAVAVDPATNYIYLTEDAGITSGFYRFVPNVPNAGGQVAPDFNAGGRLQMLAVRDQPRYDTRTGQTAFRQLPAVWVDIVNPDPLLENGARSVFAQGFAKGAARFNRLEGCWYGNGAIFFDSTSGGNVGQGQIFQYVPTGEDEGVLTLIFESPGAEVLNSPDNITFTPNGGLMLCEDGSGAEFVHGLTLDGQIFKFAENKVPGAEGSEFAGATFSPDNQTFFVNVQSPGLTFAIWPEGGRSWADGGI